MTGEEIAVLLTIILCIGLTVVSVFCSIYAQRAALAARASVVAMESCLRDWQETLKLMDDLAAMRRDGETKR